MGYEPEDLPWEVPLIELGLDSLMAVRIKNRVEYDFDLPPIQLTAVRDANLYAVQKLIEYAIEHRDEVDQLAERRRGRRPRRSPPRRRELMGGATTVAELEAKLAEAGHPLPRSPRPVALRSRSRGRGRSGAAPEHPAAADRSAAARPRPDHRSRRLAAAPRC